MSDTVLRQLWLDKIHGNTIQILASLPDEIELQKLAEIADKIADNQPASPVYAATQRQPVASVVDADDMRKLSDRLAQLSIQLQDIQKSMQQQKCNFTNRTPPESRRRRHRSLSRNRENYQDNVCWYHAKFAHQAHKCRKPCRYSANFFGRRSTQQAGNDVPGSK
ncbi:unnamed protein product [Acanthosepion pharaonis]|uniref:Uncharacterized protein n=1 Tax=Acanthosepion pharaonis TaxID=158019 RepID=A0A812D254_ACAPH|nr:unnamed protein product [Sepia pharaonis]